MFSILFITLLNILKYFYQYSFYQVKKSYEIDDYLFKKNLECNFLLFLLFALSKHAKLIKAFYFFDY